MSKMAGSKWDEVLDELTKYLEESKTNPEDIFTFCLEDRTIRAAAENFLRKCKKSSGKDSSYAALKKEEGNEKYKKKKHVESLHSYTDSIFYSNKGDESLPLAFSNRALVLEKMGYPLQSISDIDQALENGYPKKKSDLLILRKAKCLVQLGNVEQAREILKEALNKPEKNEFSHVMQQELDKIKNVKSKKPDCEEILPELLGGENKNFISASKHLSVYYDENRGRHVLATKDIQPGDVLLVEKPFAFVLFENGCHNCGNNPVAPVPCWNCRDVSFCSPKCRDYFWKSVHSFECGFSNLFKSVGIAHLSVRIILKASSSLDELKKKLNNISEPQYQNGIIPYRSNDYDSVYNLVHNSDKYEANDSFKYVMTALLLSLYLKNHTSYFPAVSDEANLRLLTSVIWRHILQLICNGHGMSGTFAVGRLEDLVFDVVQCRIGSGIYPSASMMNHSCEPSITVSFKDIWMIVRAVKKIKKGEEVFNSYGVHARRMKRAERKEILSKQYFFDCKCEACSKKFDIQDKFTAFKCTNCKGPVVPDGENSQITVCLSCGQLSDISVALLSKQNKFYFLLKEGADLLKENVTSALRTYLECWRLGREIFYKFHKDLGNAASQIARCLGTLEDFRRCILFLKCSVRLVEERYGFCSIEYAVEVKKLADCIKIYVNNPKQNAVRDLASQGVVYYQNAHRAVRSLYGPKCKMLEEIEASRRELENLLILM